MGFPRDVTSMSLAEAYAALVESFSDYHSRIAWQRQLLDRIVEEARREGRAGAEMPTPVAPKTQSAPKAEGRGQGREAIGVDGCKAGWIAAIHSEGRVRLELFRSFRDLLTRTPAPDVIAVDIPIGLAERGPRPPDVAARRMLSPLRASSVFPAPLRPVAYASSYEEACRVGREIEGKALSQQAWAIAPKIREVDQAIRMLAVSQPLVREVHPEVSFCVWNGGAPMRARKASAEGQEERRRLVEAVFGPVGDYLSQFPRSVAKPDDILDAFAALWTAQRILEGTAITLPPNPTPDGTGLRMEILA
jgi:predicted RNase H-like nuclease